MTRNQNADLSEVVQHLDAVLAISARVLTEGTSTGGRMSEGDIARGLKSVGLSPIVIAKMLEKKSPTDVAPYLHVKRKK